MTLLARRRIVVAGASLLPEKIAEAALAGLKSGKNRSGAAVLALNREHYLIGPQFRL